MKMILSVYQRSTLLFICLAVGITQLRAQTETDGIMMKKNNLCTGFMYSYSSWDHYWEGTLKRNNENLGKVSTQMIGWMGIYGITDKINVIAGIPYIKTKASAGTLHGLEGMQDLSITGKWNFWQKKLGSGNLKLIGVGGISFPASNYVADFQPLSIGLKSTNITVRVIGDYQINHFFATGAAAYVYRSNVDIDREAYYTTQMHLTHVVDMPDAVNFQFRVGYRGNVMVAEAIVTNWTTLGGFDITRNNMPFPSNKMNATMVGANLKYNPGLFPGMSILAGGGYTIAGRNMGQAYSLNAGLFYVFDFNRKTKTSK
jgi:hypothetical protein